MNKILVSLACLVFLVGLIGSVSAIIEPKVVLIKSNYTETNWIWSNANGTYDEMFFWWRTFLDTEKIPYVIKNDTEIESGDLFNDGIIKYPVVIAGEMQSVSSSEVTQLRDFVDKGGLLISNGESFAYDTSRNEQSEFYLSDVMGITKQNDVVREKTLVPYVVQYFNFLNTDHILYEGITDLKDSLVYNGGGWTLAYGASVNSSENPIVLMNITESAKTIFNPILVYNEYGTGYSLWNGWVIKPHYHNVLDVYWGIIVKNAIEKAFFDNDVPFAQIYYWKNPYHGAYPYIRMDWEDLVEGPNIINNTINWLGDMGYNAITCILSREINDVYGEGSIPDWDTEANTEINRALLLNAYQKGMTMCAHTHNHANLDQLSRSAAFDEINTSLYWVWNVTGVWAEEFVAPNYAAIKNTSILAIEDAGIYESGDMRIGLNPFILSVNETWDDDFLEIPITTLLTYDGKAVGNFETAKDNATLKTVMDFYIRNSMLVNFYQHPKCDGCTQKTQYYLTYLHSQEDLIEYSPNDLRSWVIQRNDSIISDFEYNSTHFVVTLSNAFEGLTLRINATKTVLIKNGSSYLPYFNYTMIKDSLNESIYVVLADDNNLNFTIITPLSIPVHVETLYPQPTVFKGTTNFITNQLSSGSSVVELSGIEGGSETIEQVNITITPSSGTLNVTIYNWTTTYKKWNESSDDASVITEHIIGNFTPNAGTVIKKNGVYWNNFKSNSLGYINFTYSDDYSDIQFEAIIYATIDTRPDTINLKSHGRWITAYIELPQGNNIENIDCSTLLLEGEIEAESCDQPLKLVVGDHDNDSIPDYMVRFDRSSVQGLLSSSHKVELKVTGELTDGTPFEGSDTIRVIEIGK